MDAAACDDLDLLRRYAASRDPEAFATLSRRHAGMVYAVARRITGNPHDAEDVTQACFIELARHATDVRASVAGWLHALASSRARNAVRDQAVRSRHEKQVSANQAPSDLRWEDISPHIDSAIAALPEEERAPIVMHFIYGQSQEQIARELSVSQPTVSRRINAGVQRLRKTLSGAGFSLSAAGLAAILPSASCKGAAIPATVQASLGKLAIAGIGAQTASGSSTLFAGWTTSKTLALLFASGSVLFASASLIDWPFSRPVPVGAAQVERVPPLIWGAPNSGQQTFVGALAAALKPHEPELDTTQLMGDSALAFRVRWQRISDGGVKNWMACARAYGPRELELIGSSTGWSLKVIGALGPGRADLPSYIPELVESIDQGRAIVVEDATDRQFAVVYGYEAGGRRLLLHSYGGGENEPAAGPHELGGGAVILADRARATSRSDAFLSALDAAVASWNNQAESEYGADLLTGPAAYDAWIQDTTAAMEYDVAVQQMIWRASWWNYDILCDARYHAAQYLRRNADLLPPDSRTHVLSAAAEFDRLEREALVDSVYKNPDGPKSEKTFDDWVAYDRVADLNLIAAAKAIDRRAMSQIEQALKLIKTEK